MRANAALSINGSFGSQAGLRCPRSIASPTKDRMTSAAAAKTATVKPAAAKTRYIHNHAEPGNQYPPDLSSPPAEAPEAVS